jgi:acetyl esterase/lipase
MSWMRALCQMGVISVLFAITFTFAPAFTSASALAPQSRASVCPFNIAGQNTASLLSDALLFSRHASDAVGDALIANTGAAVASTSVSAAIINNANSLDINNNGRFDIDDALIITRYLAGFRGDVLQASAADAMRISGTDVLAYINGGCVPPPAQSCPELGASISDFVANGGIVPACSPSGPVEIAYASGGTNFLLDLYKPSAGSGPFPLVIWIHGGGWSAGNKSQVELSLQLACRGYAVASINYRLSGAAIFPAQIYDTKAAIRYLRANASTLDIDPNRIGVFGSSAGGHLASLAASSGGVSSLEDLAQGNATTSSAVQAAVAWYGPSDFSQMDTQVIAQGCNPNAATHSGRDSPESKLVGCTVGGASCAPAVMRANPATYVNANTPPMLLMHGKLDCTVPNGQSTVMKTALDAAGRCSFLRNVVDGRHGGPPWSTNSVVDEVARFFDAILKP